MVGNQYNKYLIRDIKKITDRFYLVNIHGRNYLVDYYCPLRFRHFFPFSVFYVFRDEKKWSIYDVTDHEDEFKTQTLPKFTLAAPAPFAIVGSIILFLMFGPAIFALPLPVSIILFVLVLIAISFIAVNNVRKDKRVLSHLALFSKKILLYKNSERKFLSRLFKIVSVLITVLIVLFLLIMYIYLALEKIETLYMATMIYLMISVVLGNMADIRTVPNINIKYQIIEDKGN